MSQYKKPVFLKARKNNKTFVHFSHLDCHQSVLLVCPPKHGSC